MTIINSAHNNRIANLPPAGRNAASKTAARLSAVTDKYHVYLKTNFFTFSKVSISSHPPASH